GLRINREFPRLEIARAYRAALGGESQNGVMRGFHVAMMLHYVGSYKYLPTKHNGVVMCERVIQSYHEGQL
ncbi:hypothetical protein, partial [Pseudomonas sp. MWU13-2100]|uniref:hypothetical protein n=1 Tax=Pseudomonas sp. MWU13-2100 TaxID=2935075 RepID=UPI00200BB17F